MKPRWILGTLVAMGLLGACKMGAQPPSDAGVWDTGGPDLLRTVDMVMQQDMTPFPDFGLCYGKGTGHQCARDIDCGGYLHCYEGMCCNGEFHEEDCSCRCNGQICNAYEEACCAADPGWELPDGDEVKCRPFEQCGSPWGPGLPR